MSISTATSISAAELSDAKFAFSTRRINRDAIRTVLTDITPAAGQLVLARIVSIGQHQRIELATGRRAVLFEGDKIVLAFGNRYAPDQFEATVPGSLLSECSMVAAGGIAAVEQNRHAAMRPSTTIQPLGVLGDCNGKALTLNDFAIERSEPAVKIPPCYLVCGGSMNAGKTHAAVQMVRGLRGSGKRVAAAKLTGTGAGGDLWRLQDAGAAPVIDFTDVGFPSTFRASAAEIEAGSVALVNYLANQNVDAIVLEIADGIAHHETADLLQSNVLMKHVDGVVYAGDSALNMVAGVAWLQSHNIPVIAASGSVTRSPLATREAIALLDCPVLTASELAEPTILATAIDNNARLKTSSHAAAMSFVAKPRAATALSGRFNHLLELAVSGQSAVA